MQAKNQKIFYLSTQKLTVWKGNFLREVIGKLMEQLMIKEKYEAKELNT